MSNVLSRSLPDTRSWALPMPALLSALRLMAAGETYVPRTVINALPGRQASRPSFNNLTPRELDVLKLVAQGLSNADIARRLVVSDHTVHRHLANILRKLGLSSRAAAAAAGVRPGLV